MCRIRFGVCEKCKPVNFGFFLTPDAKRRDLCFCLWQPRIFLYYKTAITLLDHNLAMEEQLLLPRTWSRTFKVLDQGPDAPFLLMTAVYDLTLFKIILLDIGKSEFLPWVFTHFYSEGYFRIILHGGHNKNKNCRLE